MTKSKLHKFINKLELQALKSGDDSLAQGIAQLGKIVLVLEGKEVAGEKVKSE